MDEKLIDLQNELISVFPARLQKDPVTKIQFKEYPSISCMDFVIKTFDGTMLAFRITLINNKFYKIQSKCGETQVKKIKDVIKYIEATCGLK